MAHHVSTLRSKLTLTASLLALVVALAGCGSTQKRQQLESVARDWCMTIRASQVIPVYPLTQDIQPGDVFLVQLPVDRQQQQYQQRGFLPLDNHLARLNIDTYDEFYSKSFLGREGESAYQLPLDWLRPRVTGNDKVPAWALAPGAAFPTYSFSVSSSAGLNLAVPISGVPVGLSLLGADSANGTISINDARTLGIDIMSLHQQVHTWLDESPNHRDFLAAYGTPANQPPRNFLRVVSRIFLTGQLDVSLYDASTRAAGVDVGLARPLASMLVSTPDADTSAQDASAKNYDAVIMRLNELLKSSQPASGQSLAPGGSVRIAAASARSIALSEIFNPPLVIGYLGFDLPILENGVLGDPIPTHALINGSIIPPTGPQATLRNIAEPTIVKAMLDAISRDESPAALKIRRELDTLIKFIPKPKDAIRIEERDPTSDGTPQLAITRASWRSVNIDSYLSYRANRDASRRLLQTREPGTRVLNALKGETTVASDEDIQLALKLFAESADEQRAFRLARAALTEYYLRSTP
jgi:hypothetical protein